MMTRDGWICQESRIYVFYCNITSIVLERHGLGILWPTGPLDGLGKEAKVLLRNHALDPSSYQEL